MTDTNTQAPVDETNATAAPVAEASNAAGDASDLESILKEFETQTKPEPKLEQKPQASTQVDNDLRREVAELKFKMEFEPVLNKIRGDIPKDVISDEELTDLVDGRAKRDPKLQNAWLNRSSNPAAWSKVEKALHADLSKKFQPRVDKNATEDREVVAAAVRAASTTKASDEKPPDLSRMSNGEYRQWVMSNHGYDPGV